jgi:hypothetical protein
VMPAAVATRTASDVGAETAAIIGAPSCAVFWGVMVTDILADQERSLPIPESRRMNGPCPAVQFLHGRKI